MLKLSEDITAAAEKLKDHFVFYSNFPKKGIQFWDVFALVRNPEAFKLLNFILSGYANVMKNEVDVVVGIESRGFLFGPLLANLMNCTFVPVRKQGKLPGKTKQLTYSLEYGTDTIEIQEDSIKSSERVLIVDDCIATGGTLRASCDLVHSLGAKIVECMLIYIIPDFNVIDQFPVPVRSLCN